MDNNFFDEDNNSIKSIDTVEQNPKYTLLNKIILFTEFILIFSCLAISIMFFVERFLLNTSYKHLIAFFSGTLIFTIFIAQILVYKLRRINESIQLLDSLVIIITCFLYIIMSLCMFFFTNEFLIYPMIIISIITLIYIFIKSSFSFKTKVMCTIYCLIVISTSLIYSLKDISFNANYFYVCRTKYDKSYNDNYYKEIINPTDYEELMQIFDVASDTGYKNKGELTHLFDSIGFTSNDTEISFEKFFNLSKYDSSYFENNFIAFSVVSLKDKSDEVSIDAIHTAYSYEKVYTTFKSNEYKNSYPCTANENEAFCIVLLEIPKNEMNNLSHIPSIVVSNGFCGDYFITYT